MIMLEVFRTSPITRKQVQVPTSGDPLSGSDDGAFRPYDAEQKPEQALRTLVQGCIGL